MVHWKGKIHWIAGIAAALLAAATTVSATASNGITGGEQIYVALAGLLAGLAGFLIGRRAIGGL